MNPVSKTAYYCCGARAEDASSANPLCGDVFAARFLAGEGERVFAEFKDEIRPNQTNVSRHRIIDDLVRDALQERPDRWVVLIGAGFDSRALRLAGGRWVELDEPQIVELKNERLPAADCTNELHRIPIRFGEETIADKLAPIDIENPLVIVEGVLMYSDRGQTRDLLDALIGQFPEHRLVCDLMTRKFFNRYSRSLHERIGELGTGFTDMNDNPEGPLLASGYRRFRRRSIVASGAKLRHGGPVSLLIKTFMPSLANGYAIYEFDAGSK